MKGFSCRGGFVFLVMTCCLLIGINNIASVNATLANEIHLQDEKTASENVTPESEQNNEETFTSHTYSESGIVLNEKDWELAKDWVHVFIRPRQPNESFTDEEIIKNFLGQEKIWLRDRNYDAVIDSCKRRVAEAFSFVGDLPKSDFPSLNEYKKPSLLLNDPVFLEYSTYMDKWGQALTNFYFLALAFELKGKFEDAKSWYFLCRSSDNNLTILRLDCEKVLREASGKFVEKDFRLTYQDVENNRALVEFIDGFKNLCCFIVNSYNSDVVDYMLDNAGSLEADFVKHTKEPYTVLSFFYRSETDFTIANLYRLRSNFAASVNPLLFVFSDYNPEPQIMDKLFKNFLSAPQKAFATENEREEYLKRLEESKVATYHDLKKRLLLRKSYSGFLAFMEFYCNWIQRKDSNGQLALLGRIDEKDLELFDKAMHILRQIERMPY